MKKLPLSLIALSCALALTACSSSSKGGSSDNSAELKKTEAALRQKLAEVEKSAENAKQSTTNAQNKVATTETKLNEANAQSTKLAAQVATLAEQQATAEKKMAELALAQAEAKNASEEEIAKLKANVQKANEDLAAAQAETQKANDAVAKLIVAEQQAQAEKEATAKRLQNLENLQADEKARIPVSANVFGGVDGVMKKSLAGLSGAVWTQSNDQWNEAVLPASTEGINDIYIVEKSSGKAKHVPVTSASWGSVGKSDYYGYSIASNNSKFSDVRFGSYVDNLDGSLAVYSQGNATDVSQMPTSGKVTYKGGITNQKDDNYESLGGGNRLTANVDFGSKTVDITVAAEKYNNIPEMAFGGKITQNSFAGEVNGIKTQGGFFGENASQLSGVYINTNDNSRGAYGAVKVEE